MRESSKSPEDKARSRSKSAEATNGHDMENGAAADE